MAAQSTASRSPRPQRPDSDDVLYARAIEFAGWARTNIRIIIGAAIVVALLVGGLIYYRVYQADRQARAAREFLQLEQTAASGNLQLATRDLEAYIRRFGGTVQAEEARILLAQLQLQQNQAAQAIATLRGAEGRIDDSPVGPQAALLLAAAHEAADNRQAAIDIYLRVAEEAELAFRRNEALENAAMLRTQAGDFAGAAELYQRLVDAAEEGTPERQLYEMRLAEVQARAAAK